MIVALIGMALAFIAPYKREPEAEEHATATRPAGAWAIYLVIGLSGLCALGALFAARASRSVSTFNFAF